MEWFWLGLIVLGCVCITAIQAVKRLAMKGGAIDPTRFLVWQFSCATALYGALYIFVWGFTWPELGTSFWSAVVGCAFANLFIQWLGTKAASLSAGDVSLTAPLQAMTPGMITLLALSLGEFPGWLGIAGIACMAVGTYYLTWPKQREGWYDWIGPLYHLRRLTQWRSLNAEDRSRTLAISLSLGSAAIGTFGLLFESLYTRRAGDLQGLVLGSTTVCLLLALGYAFAYFVSGGAAKATPVTRHLVFGSLIMGALFVAHWMCIQPGFAHFLTSYVGTLKRLSILFTVCIGVFVFKEAKDRTQLKDRLWAAGFITVGSILIACDGLMTNVVGAVERLGF